MPAERIVALELTGEQLGWALALDPGGCYRTGTSEPDEGFVLLRHWLSAADVVVCGVESLRSPSTLMSQQVDRMASERGVPVHWSIAAHKQQARTRARARNIAALDGDRLARAAQLHAWWWIWNKEQVGRQRRALTRRQGVR